MNDWKNYVTVAMNEKFDQVLQERADKCPFSAKYTQVWRRGDARLISAKSNVWLYDTRLLSAKSNIWLYSDTHLILP